MKTGDQYTVLLPGAYLARERREPVRGGTSVTPLPSVTLQPGDVVTFLRNRPGLGSDSISSPMFRNAEGVEGEFRPHVWGTPKREFLAKIQA